MAAGLLDQLAGGRVHVRTAGLRAGRSRSTRPWSRRWPSSASTSAREFPKPLTDEAVEAADVVITMGCGDACPFYPGKRYEDWELEDPAGKDLETVRRIRDEIAERVDAPRSARRCRPRHDRRPLPRRLLAEFLGSAFLAAAVIGSGIAAQQLSPGDVGLQLLRERGGDGGGAVHHHPHVRPGLRRPLQPGRLARRRELRRPSLAPRVRLHPRPGRAAASPARSPPTRCSPWRR